MYDATGTKLKRTSSSGTETLYSGKYIYEGAVGNSQLQFFGHPEGYVTPDGQGGYDYVYQYKDHLGNVRLSYQDNNGTLEIVEESNYYPFGGKHKGYNEVTSPFGNSTAQRWKFNGKEYDESLGLETYDFGARNYDPWLGRWGNIDNKSDDYTEWSPYSYSLNSPLYFLDPDGNSVNDVWSYNVDTNKLEWVSDDGGSQIQTVVVTNNDSEIIGAKAVQSSTVFVMETSNSVLISGYDHQIPEGYNSNTGYEYTADDLGTRRRLIENGYGDFVAGLENSGNSGELSQQHFYDNYVQRTPNNSNSAFWHGIEGGYFGSLLPGGGSSGKVAGEGLKRVQSQGSKLTSQLAKSKQSFKNLSRKTNVGARGGTSGSLSSTAKSSIANATKSNAASSRSATQIRNSWNKFLNQNKGKYSGKDWIKRAARDYSKQKTAN